MPAKGGGPGQSTHFPGLWTDLPLESLMTIGFAFTNDDFTGEILTVAQLNQAVGRLLDRSIPSLWVRGEISNFTQAASGHWYFTLKDSRAAVRAVMFRSRAQATGFLPRAGDQVELRARVCLYEPRGDYQLQADAMRRAGLGDLYERFLRLKEKLAAEGLFDADRKRAPAPLPRAIGVVTSLAAAALRDVVSALARRAPHVPVVVYPAPVQGADAAPRLIAALATANQRREVDTLLLVRGGGSIEDLWSFNDEALARAVAASSIPVISGVGHETDFTIADFVADLRAPTPTAAAELACVPREQWVARMSQAGRGLARGQTRALERASQRVDRAAARLVSPAQRLAHQRDRLEALRRRLAAAWREPQARRTGRLELAQFRLTRRVPDVEGLAARLRQLLRRLPAPVPRRLAAAQMALDAAAGRMRTLDPRHTLARGYAIVRDAHGGIVRDAARLEQGQPLALEFARGAADATVEAVRPDRA